MPHLDQKAIRKLSQRRCTLQGRQGKEDTEDISEDHLIPSGFPTQILYTRWTLFSNLFFFLAFDFRRFSRSEIDFSLFWFSIFFYVWKIVKKCLSKWTEFIFWINRSGCYICRMSCQQLYIEQKIQIILYTAKYMHVRFNYDNDSFERGLTQKNDRLWGGGGGMRKNEDWVGGPW